MLFCPECDSLLDINKQTSESTFNKNMDIKENETILKKMLNSEDITDKEVASVNIDIITETQTYLKLDKKTKQSINKKITDLINKLKKTHGFIYKCHKCGYTKPLVEQTLIMSKIGNDSKAPITPQKIINVMNDKILPHTRNYICKNPKCISNTDITKRDAVFFRLDNSLQTWYVCTACKTYWT